jgi:hypothetical protein
VARPHLELGTHGRIGVYPDPARHRAACLYRDWDGVTREVQRQARTKGAAERSLSVALRDRGRPRTGSEITPDIKIAVLAEKWFNELEGKSPSTMQAYRDRLDRQVLPALGSVRVREISVGLLDRHLAAVRASHGPALAKMTKSVISGICGLACPLTTTSTKSHRVLVVAQSTPTVARVRVAAGDPRLVGVAARSVGRCGQVGTIHRCAKGAGPRSRTRWRAWAVHGPDCGGRLRGLWNWSMWHRRDDAEIRTAGGIRSFTGWSAVPWRRSDAWSSSNRRLPASAQRHRVSTAVDIASAGSPVTGSPISREQTMRDAAPRGRLAAPE